MTWVILAVTTMLITAAVLTGILFVAAAMTLAASVACIIGHANRFRLFYCKAVWRRKPKIRQEHLMTEGGCILFYAAGAITAAYALTTLL